ncbi:MAG: adenylate/guanylate cyclase with Chase sensor [Verrucomicrobia bacterium]|nr:adenylate/guanylate cyclase with Chase sensor [Verrucomicrobiota bacterium]
MVPPKTRVALSPLLWLISLAIPAFWCALSQFGVLDSLEERLLDWRYEERGEIEAPVKIVYVDIDAHSLDEIGGWPWSRAHFAQVAAALIGRGGARAVGIDIVFSDRNRPDRSRKLLDGNVELVRYLETKPPVVLAASYAEAQFRDFGTQQTTVGQLPMMIVRTLFTSGSSAPAPRRNSHDVPLLGEGAWPGAQFEPPEMSALNVGKKDPWIPARLGLLDTVEGGTRWVPAYTPTVMRSFRAMAVELALAYWGLNGDSVKTYEDRIEIVTPGGRRMAVIPLSSRQLIEVNWFSAWNSGRNPRFGFSTVLKHASLLDSVRRADKTRAAEFFAQPVFQDAIVLIGPVDPLLHDLAPTPFNPDPVPRVGVQGNLLKTIFSGKFIHRLPTWQNYVLLFGLTILISQLAIAGGSRGTVFKLTAALAVILYVWFSVWIFRTRHVVLPVSYPLASVFTTSFVAMIWQLVSEERQKRRIKGMFGAYVSPQLVQRMVDSGEGPQLGGHKQDLTAYFSDIESFSKFSEMLDSEKLVELMNEYLSACTDILEEESGTVDKYIGDAVMAMFGAPVPINDHAYRACVASQRVQERLAALRLKWKAEGDRWPEIVSRMQSRIGLNSGATTVGNIGSRSRLNYTVMGDNVNLAARMESGAKQYGVRTMATEATKLGCEQHGGDRVVFRYLDRIVVKGRSAPVPIYEIVGLKENLTEEMQECMEWFDRGMKHYLAQEWDRAKQCFERSASLEANRPGVTPGIESNPSLVFLDRCARMRQNPPGPGWDGTYMMPEK